MGFDRDTIIGFALLGLLFIGYFWYNTTSQQKYQAFQKHTDDSIAAAKAKMIDPVKLANDSARFQSATDSIAAGDFQDTTNNKESESYVENNVMKITFSNKGGWMKQVQLKHYKGVDSQLVVMGGLPTDHFGYAINTGNNQVTTTDKLYFNSAIINKLADGSQTISYQLVSKDKKSITHTFTVKPDNYMIDAKVDLTGADRLLTQQNFNVDWAIMARQQQKNITYEKQQLKLVAYTNNDFDSWSAIKDISQQLDKPTSWIGLKQQFFNATIIAPTQNFKNLQTAITVAPSDTIGEVGRMVTTGSIQVAAGNTASIPLQIYYGPNDYEILKAYDNGMRNIVDLGSGFTAFVKYINRGFIMPIFNFLVTIVGGKIGWAILLLTVLIRLVISPITYRSYLSGAKMKVMQPELKTLKAKFGDDQQAYSVAQMKLFREAGINPLSGCIPMAAQLPVFFALFAFFNSNIGLRGQPFLWAHDLSTYDSIWNFAKLPILGDHISLFTITACISSFFISMYSMSSTPDQSNPAMKYMPYIFPFMMLFFFNNQPAALTWYYTVSNTITLVIQVVIQKYIIDHDKILAEISVKRSQPKTKSKWQERLEAMQNTQKSAQDLKSKSGKK